MFDDKAIFVSDGNYGSKVIEFGLVESETNCKRLETVVFKFSSIVVPTHICCGIPTHRVPVFIFLSFRAFAFFMLIERHKNFVLLCSMFCVCCCIITGTYVLWNNS